MAVRTNSLLHERYFWPSLASVIAQPPGAQLAGLAFTSYEFTTQCGIAVVYSVARRLKNWGNFGAEQVASNIAAFLNQAG